jgi:hypothetical protein
MGFWALFKEAVGLRPPNECNRDFTSNNRRITHIRLSKLRSHIAYLSRSALASAFVGRNFWGCEGFVEA